MSKAKELRAITNEVLEKRKKQEEAEMKKFWSEAVEKFELCAKEGRNFGYINIPCNFDAMYILKLAQDEEFTFDRTGSREWKICW